MQNHLRALGDVAPLDETRSYRWAALLGPDVLQTCSRIVLACMQMVNTSWWLFVYAVNVHLVKHTGQKADSRQLHVDLRHVEV